MRVASTTKASTKIVLCPRATCFVTNHWVNANQTKTILSLVIILQQSLDQSATTPMDHCHTLQHLHVFVVKKMGAPVQTGCIATHQIPNVKQYPIRLGFRPAIRLTIPTQTRTLVCAVPPSVHPPSMDPIASRPSAVAVVLRENSESTVPIVVKHAVRVRLRLLLVWWVDAPAARPVNMAPRQRGKQLKRRVKIVVLEKPRTLLVQSVNRFAKIVSKVPTPTCQVCPVVKFASAAMRWVSRVHQIVPRVCPDNSMRTIKNFVKTTTVVMIVRRQVFH